MEKIISNLKKCSFNGQSYFKETDSMDRIVYFQENRSNDIELIRDQIDCYLSNINDAFIDSLVKSNLNLCNHYYFISNELIARNKISIFTKKEFGKLIDISMLYINDSRELIFKTVDIPEVIAFIKNIFKVNEFYILTKENRTAALANRLRNKFTI
ncbi:hypothetical protein [Chryseobacterium oncorhynchi]|uniref:Uncharacterized protein n=1 Tax=Chryseobacterium oncorhynchi TaxID=741074 RepID=A0A316WGN2_9FLAO|nr:hypothetical protein [Chryseobacterium oncorhynchi]PWN59553.1 hypothetical protein C1638_021360 [Chryseobacterium oncorhynchi]